MGPQDTMSSPADSNQYSRYGFKEAKKQFERDYIFFKLQENKGNISQTAEQIGMERSHLHKKIKITEY